jgi:hypothetical protein
MKQEITFHRNISSPSSGSKNKPGKKSADAERRALTELHGITTHKTVLFIATALRISNPT